MIIKFTLLLGILLSLISCNDISMQSATNDHPLVKVNAKKPIQQIIFEPPKTPIHIEVFYPQDEKLNKLININQPDGISLINAINITDITPIAEDNKVDLKQVLTLSFDGNLKDYLIYLSRLTGYDVSLENNVIKINSTVYHKWNLASISSDTNNAIISDNVQKNISTEWLKVVETIKKLLGEEAVVSANLKTGVVHAYASPIKIKQADFYVNNLIKNSKQQVHLSVTILDVSLNNAKGRGIDWSIVSEGINGAISIASSQPQIIDGAGLIQLGTLNNNALLNQGDVSVKLLISLLEKQGNVIVQDQPNITVLNGDAGIISTGTEFSYISKINANTDQNGNVVSTAEVERLNVGVSMQVSAKVLDKDKVLINVVPILSSLQNFTNIESGEQSFQTPNITLQKLSTQAIVSSGKTMHLGGLISEKIINASKFLPNNSLLGTLFASKQSSLEKREIVILITPTIIK